MASFQEPIPCNSSHDPQPDNVQSVEKGYFTARAKLENYAPALQQASDEGGRMAWRYLTDGDLVQ
jgi:hypothetical protein